MTEDKNYRKIIKEYFTNLSNGNYEELIKLFSEDCVVYSPLYGKRDVKSFYRELIDDSDEDSKVELVESFVNVENLTGAGNFKYSWILKNGKSDSFEGVDLFKFQEDGKIIQVKIIYDTSGVRSDFEEMKK